MNQRQHPKWIGRKRTKRLASALPDKGTQDIHQYAQDNYKRQQLGEPVRAEKGADASEVVYSQTNIVPLDGPPTISAQPLTLYQPNDEQSRVFSGGPGASVPTTVYENTYDTFAPKLVPDWSNPAIIAPPAVLSTSGMQYRSHALPVPMQLWPQQVAQLSSVYTPQPSYTAHFAPPPTYLPPQTDTTAGRGSYATDAPAWAESGVHNYGNHSR
jgi:hypothetical protein